MQLTVTKRWLHPEGIYPAQLVTFEECSGQFGPQIKWVWETNVERDDGDPPQLSFRTSQKISGKSNLGKMLAAIGIPLPETDEEAQALDLDALIGKRVRIQVKHNLAPDGETWANIEAFAPLKGGQMTETTKREAGPADGGNGKHEVGSPPEKDPFQDQ